MVAVWIAGSLMSLSARADTQTWVGSGTGDWTSGANWSGSAAPTATDGALIDNGGTAEVGTGVSAEALSLAAGDAAAGSVAVTGGLLEVSGTALLGQQAGGSGSILVTNGGTLAAGAITQGSGTGALSVDGGTLKALADGSLVSGFSGSGFSLGMGGAIVDTDGHAATINSEVSGPGGLTKAGAGDLVFSEANSYAGGTVLEGGALRITETAAIGTGVLMINSGTLGNAAEGQVVFLENDIMVNADFAIDVSGTDGAVENFGSVDLGAAATRTITLTGEGLACFGGTISGRNLTLVTTGTSAQAMFCSDTGNVFTGTLRVGSGVQMELQKVSDAVAVSGDLLVDEGAAVLLEGFEQFAATSNVEVNGTLVGLSAGQNTINALSGTGTIDGVYPDTLAVNSGTFAGAITEDQALLKQGAGVLLLTGSSSFTGGTTVASGTLQAQNNHALGNGNVAVTGSGRLSISADTHLDLGGGHGITLENNGTASYAKDFSAGEDLSNLNAVTSSGSNATVAQILSGTASAALTLRGDFADTPSSPASNDEDRISDVFALGGAGGETFVMQLSYTQEAFDAAVLAGIYDSELELRLGWLSGGQWVAMGDGLFVDGAWNASYATLGTYGVDTVNNEVWVVTNHGGDTSVVPEPGSWGLLALGGVIVWWRKRRLETANRSTA